jgi:signal peptidase II
MRGVLKYTSLAAAIAFGADQLSRWAIQVMEGHTEISVTGFFNLVLGRNTGVSFGLFNEAPPWLLVGITLAIVLMLLVWASRERQPITAVALGLIIGGALGNMLDRLRHSGVTDFLDFHIGGIHWPAFNLADTAIVLGVMLLLFDAFRREMRFLTRP